MDYTVHLIPVQDIFADPEFNSRGLILPSSIEDLKNDIKRYGIREPLTVRPRPNGKYHLVAGHRRFLCAQLLKLETVPCFVRPLSDLEAAIINLSENIQRQDLNILQEAKGVEAILKQGKLEFEVAELLNKSKHWVRVRILLLTLPEHVQKLAAAGVLSQEQIVSASKLSNDPEKLNDFVRSCKEARERGEKPVKLKENKEPNIYAAKKRSETEIINLITRIYEMFNGHIFASKCLSWAIGETPDILLELSLADECKRRGVEYKPPAHSPFEKIQNVS